MRAEAVCNDNANVIVHGLGLFSWRKRVKHIKRITAGRFTWETIYTPPTVQDAPKQRAARSKATTEAQALLNFKDARRQLTLLLAENFTPCDYFCTLTYDDKHLPANRAEMLKDVKKAVRRYRAAYKKLGTEFRYIYAVEGATGAARYHVHIVLNAATGNVRQDADIIASLWGNGSVEAHQLDKYWQPQGAYIDYETLAAYMTKETCPGAGKPNGARKWTSSQNLRRPKADKVERVSDSTDIIAPVGAYVLDSFTRRTPYAEYKYLFYVTPLSSAERPKHRLNERLQPT